MKNRLNWTKGIGKNAAGEVGVLETQRANYTDREARNEHYQRLKKSGTAHVGKFTTHDGNNPQIIYVVTWSEPKSLAVAQTDSTK